jgi:hypothetical protein
MAFEKEDEDFRNGGRKNLGQTDPAWGGKLAEEEELEDGIVVVSIYG